MKMQVSDEEKRGRQRPQAHYKSFTSWVGTVCVVTKLTIAQGVMMVHKFPGECHS